MYSIFYKLLVSVLLTCMCLFKTGFNNSLITDNAYKLQYDGYDDLEHEDSFDDKVYCKNGESTFDSNEWVYAFESTFHVADIQVIGDASLVTSTIIDNSISCKISLFLLEEGQFTIHFENRDDDIFDKYTIYFCKGTDGTIFSSSLSLDIARRNADKKLSYFFEQEVYDSTSLYNGYDIATAGSGVSGSVSGHLKFNDDSQELPLVGAKVKVIISGSLLESETYTDENGYYSISYSNVWHVGSGKPIIYVYASGENVSVKYSGIYTMAHEFDGTSGDFIYNRTFSSDVDGDFGKVINIFQAAQQYASFAKSLPDSDSISHCDLYYPGEVEKGCYYSPKNSTITITSKIRANSFVPESYCAWDVIGHEYGHHIQNCMGFSANVGGKHSSLANDIDANVTEGRVTSEIKERGLKLAWNESWPTYFSIMAQKYILSDFKNIATVNDTFYTSYNGLNYDLDPSSYPIDCAYGDGCERAIMRFLYKLSSPTLDAYDCFSISFEIIWDITCASKATTLFDFVNELYNYGLNRHDLGRLLSVFNIAIGSLTITNDYLDRCPSFTWSTYMGSSYLRYNEFDLVVANSQGQEILRKSDIPSISNNACYTLTRNEWAAVISSYDEDYFVYIVSRQTDFFTSGNYYSELFRFRKPEDFIDKIQIKPSDWGFEPQYFFTTNKWKQTSTPISDNGLTITHDRLRCGYIEDSYVILSPRRENAGLAYLTMKFDKPIYSYMFGIALWSNSENLHSSDSTAIVEALDENGSWHEDLNLMTDLPNGFSVKSQKIDRYEIAHTEGIFGLRFAVTSSAVGSRNKGRLCLDDIVLNTDLDDLWFISTFYK